MLRVFICLRRVRKGSWSPEDTTSCHLTVSCLTSTVNLFIIVSVSTTVFPLILVCFPSPVCPFLSLRSLPWCQISDVGQTKGGQKPGDTLTRWIGLTHMIHRDGPNQSSSSLCAYFNVQKKKIFNLNTINLQRLQPWHRIRCFQLESLKKTQRSRLVCVRVYYLTVKSEGGGVPNIKSVLQHS